MIRVRCDICNGKKCYPMGSGDTVYMSDDPCPACGGDEYVFPDITLEDLHHIAYIHKHISLESSQYEMPKALSGTTTKLVVADEHTPFDITLEDIHRITDKHELRVKMMPVWGTPELLKVWGSPEIFKGITISGKPWVGTPPNVVLSTQNKPNVVTNTQNEPKKKIRKWRVII